jgi:hypothetical protein
MGLEANTSIALHEAGFESYWRHGICRVQGEDTDTDRRNIVVAANSVLNTNHEFYTWRDNDEWNMKTRERL